MNPYYSKRGDHRLGRADDSRPALSRDVRHPISRSLTGPSRQRSEDSWIEIASQPSSSSLSSAGEDTAARLAHGQHDPSTLRRRRRRQLETLTTRGMNSPTLSTNAQDSSQDEYEESDESERVMNSSNEDLPQDAGRPLPSPGLRGTTIGDEEDEDEDDTSTALGTRTSEPVFTPQPHAFSQPSSTQVPHAEGSTRLDSYFPPESTRLPSNRTITQRDLRRGSSSRPATNPQHTPYNVVAPSRSYQPDHDAALRASLSTLLSCAAAARGLPKPSQPSRSQYPAQSAAVDPTSIRLIPESRLHRGDSSPLDNNSIPPRRSRATTVSSASMTLSSPPPESTSGPSKPSTKRKVRESSKDRLSRASKKSRSAAKPAIADETVISPTLMTWMISAGFVVLFSAASFAAGYAWGREIGRMEAGIAPTKDGMQYGRDMVGRGTSLKRLRWGGGSSSVRVGA